SHCNQEMVLLEPLDDPEEVIQVKEWVERHARRTDSPLARRLLSGWSGAAGKFVKVIPIEYKKHLQKEAR
ncbi:MAG: hypothetical protein PHY12_08610, partial [Eubacteriales bacterium]|nr:hypothetical protein [Eubacteriales bacterium]